MSKADVIVPEIIENPELDQIITTTLKKHNVTDAVIESLKEKYSGLSLASVDDKEGYLNIKEAKKEVRKWGILTEKLCKEGREDAIKTQKLWLKKEKEILGKISEVQDPLDKEIDRYEAEVERKELEEKKRKEDAAIHRQAELSRMGAQYINGYFILNDVSFDAATIKEADEDVWSEHMLPKYKIQYEKIEAVRIEEENKKREQEEKMRKEREDLERQQREFKEAQERFQKEKEDAERKQRQEQDQRESEARKKANERIDARCNQLRALGMSFDFKHNAYTFEDVNVDNPTEICLLDDTEWATLINKITPVIADRKKAAEEKRLAEIKEQKEAERIKTLGESRMNTLKQYEAKVTVEIEDLGNMPDVDWENVHAGWRDAYAKKQRDKWEQEQAEKKRIEDAKKTEELAQAGDKQKWESFLSQLNNILWHEMKSGPYRKKIAMAKEKIEEICEL